MVVKQAQKKQVTKVTKAIAEARGTDNLSLTQVQRSGSAAAARVQVADEHARDGIRLSFLIHDVSRMRRRAYDQFMKPLGITRAQWWVLAHLSRHDGMRQTQLADVLEVGKASLGDVIESLETGGWVARRADPADKRAKRVYLTRPSQSLIKRMTVLELDFNSKVLVDINPEECTALIASLQKVKRAIAKLGNL